MKEIRLPPVLSPCCGHIVDTVSGLDHDAAPAPGDLTICINCGAILCFIDPIVGRLRVAHLSDLDWITSQEFEMLSATQQYIVDRGRITKHS